MKAWAKVGIILVIEEMFVFFAAGRLQTLAVVGNFIGRT